jgi:DNA polymerase-3 subunit beta
VASLMKKRSSPSKKRAPAKKEQRSTGVTVDAVEFRRALMSVKAACSTKSAVDALQGVLIVIDGDGGTVTCTDMDIAMRAQFTAEGALSALVLHKTLVEAIKGAKGPIELAVETDSAFRQQDMVLVVRRGVTSMRVRTLRIEDWPPLDFTRGTRYLSEDAGVFDDLVTRIAVFATRDETRPVLTGISISKTGVVATDSYRLMVAPAVGSVRRKTPLLLPAVGLSKIVKRVKGRVVIFHDNGATRAVVSAGEIEATIRTIDGQYPNYQQLLPDAWTGSLWVNRAELLELTKQAVGLARRAAPMRLGFGASGRLTVEVHGNDLDPSLSGAIDIVQRSGEKTMILRVGERNLPADEIGVNPAFFHDAVLLVGTAETVEIRFINPMRPLLVVDGDDGDHGEMALLMPIRLNI